MNTLLVTTVCRNTAPEEPTGFIYTIDLDGMQVTGGCPVIEPPLLREDPNPRGGMRGAKGISTGDGSVFIANHSCVFQFDAEWNRLREISHPSCAGIHDIVYRDGSLWVTSSRNDVVFELDLDGRVLRHVNLRALAEVRERAAWKEPNLLTEDDVLNGAIDFRDPRTHRYETYDGAHVNSVAFLPNGDLLIMMGLVFGRAQTRLFTLKKHLKRLGLWQPLVFGNKIASKILLGGKKAMNTEMAVNVATGKSLVVRIGQDRTVSVPVLLENVNTPAHSLLPEAGGTVLFDNTSTGEVIRFDPESGETTLRVKVTDAFLRGICRVSEDTVAVGAQGDVCLVDLARKTVAGRVRLSTNPNEAIYDINPLPPGFMPLPDRLDG